MKGWFLRGLWGLLAVGAVVFGVQAFPNVPENMWVLPALIVIGGVTVWTLLGQDLPFLSKVLNGFRSKPILFWLVVLVYMAAALGWWTVIYQPTNGRLLFPFEFFYLCAVYWLFLVLVGYGMTTGQARAMGAKLAKSRLSGVMVMLTTALLIFGLAETYMRIFYVTTDGYGFTAMNYHWYKNFLWADRNRNSLGYRDYEPLPDETGEAVQRVAIVGDSFAIGHGINNIDDSFPQLLEKQLGAGWDVNLIATSGWDSDVETGYLNAYYENLVPRLPKIVVLSYYLNDIDYLLRDPAVNPDAAFTFPENPTLSWFVLNFFVPNYVYYNVLQFTSPTRTVNFTDRLINAHLDDGVWSQQAATLQQMIDWAKNHDAQMMVLLWPQIAAVADSQPATQRVKQFFEEQGATVVDMSEWLEGKSTSEMILNRFDSHPSIAANHLAAQALYEAIEGGS